MLNLKFLPLDVAMILIAPNLLVKLAKLKKILYKNSVKNSG